MRFNVFNEEIHSDKLNCLSIKTSPVGGHDEFE